MNYRFSYHSFRNSYHGSGPFVTSMTSLSTWKFGQPSVGGFLQVRISLLSFVYTRTYIYFECLCTKTYLGMSNKIWEFNSQLSPFFVPKARGPLKHRFALLYSNIRGATGVQEFYHISIVSLGSN